jgi:predicted RNase H-like nuclease
VIRCLGVELPAAWRDPMQRRTFMNVTAGAATALALKPWALAEQQQRNSQVVYPDPAVEVVDPRFAKYKVGNAAVERLYTGTRWAEGLVWFADGISSSATSPTTECCDGWKRLERSAFSAAPRTTATATVGTDRAGCAPASTTRAG